MRKEIRIVLSCFILLLMGCQTATKEKILKVFFDGVPEEDIEKQKRLQRMDEALTELKKKVKSENVSQLKGQEAEVIFQHPPFQERQCDACHESKISQKLIAEGKDLCFICHDDFLKKVKTPHYPADEGECLECHHPHKAPNKFLLKRKGHALCFECHDQKDIMAIEIHADIGEESCTTCHNPHGEE